MPIGRPLVREKNNDNLIYVSVPIAGQVKASSMSESTQFRNQRGRTLLLAIGLQHTCAKHHLARIKNNTSQAKFITASSSTGEQVAQMIGQLTARNKGPPRAPVLFQVLEDLIDGAPDEVTDAPNLQRAPRPCVRHAHHCVGVCRVPLEVHHLRIRSPSFHASRLLSESLNVVVGAFSDNQLQTIFRAQLCSIPEPLHRMCKVLALHRLPTLGT